VEKINIAIMFDFRLPIFRVTDEEVGNLYCNWLLNEAKIAISQ
jgi:hypothetical protein